MRGYIILIVISLFFGLLMQVNSQDQSKAKPNAEAEARLKYLQRQHEDSVKGRLLYEMAQYMWLEVYGRGIETIPNFNPGRVEEFRLSVVKNPGDNNPANITKLYDLAEKELGNKKFRNSSPEEVAQSILSALQKYFYKKRELPNFQDFQGHLEKIYKDDKLQIRAENPKLTGAETSPSTPNKILERVKIEKSFFQIHPIRSAAIAAFMGFLVGGILGVAIFYLKKRPKIKEHKQGNIDPQWSINELEGKNNRLSYDKSLLEEKIKALEREVGEKANLIKNLQTQIPSFRSSTQEVGSSIGQSLSDVNSIVENTTKSPSQIKTCFAPAAEDPFIEQSKVYPVHSGAAAVMLTIDPKNPDRAEFEFSPYADQAHIINTSITQLDQFFEYTLPSKGFSKIKSIGKGTLQLENGHWVRKTKARLELQ